MITYQELIELSKPTRYDNIFDIPDNRCWFYVNIDKTIFEFYLPASSLKYEIKLKINDINDLITEPIILNNIPCILRKYKIDKFLKC